MGEGKANPKLWAIVTLGAAVVLCLGTILGAIMNGPIAERLLNDFEPTKMNTPMILVVTATVIPKTDTNNRPGDPVETVPYVSTQSPLPIPGNTLVGTYYFLGYDQNDLAYKATVADCSDCNVVFLTNAYDLPDDWRQYTANVASASANLSDGCRTKEELINLSVLYMTANNWTPCP